MKLQYFESDSGHFETNSVTDGKPVQIRKNRRDVTEPRFWVTTRASVFCTSCSRARFEVDVPTRRELQ